MRTFASQHHVEQLWAFFARPHSAAIAGSATLLAAVLLLPGIDLAIAQYFYVGQMAFWGEDNAVIIAMRKAFLNAYILICIFTVAALVLTRDRQKSCFQRTFTQWLFLAICLAVGPGIVANLALKDQWGRARPRDVIEFGGTQKFTAALAPSKACNRNCSFVCGESSSIFVVFFAAACVWRRHSKRLIVAGLALGSIAGFVRVAQGAHFFSDVIFSGLFMAMSVGALHWLFEVISKSDAPPRSASSPWSPTHTFHAWDASVRE